MLSGSCLCSFISLNPSFLPPYTNPLDSLLPFLSSAVYFLVKTHLFFLIKAEDSFMHDRVIDINPTMGKGRKKFWYFVSFSFLIWFLMLVVYYSGSNSHVPSPRDNSVDPIDTHESVGVIESENPNERVMEDTGKTGEFTESSKYSDRTYDVIDHFFTGGDWDRFLSETSDSNQESKEEDTLPLTGYETQSINKVFGKVNNQGYGSGESPKGNGVEKPINSSAPTEESTTEEVTTTQPSEKGGESVDESNPDVNSESCWGRYIYVHDIPNQFNEDLLKHCKSLSEWTNMCPFTSNMGLGPRVRNSERALSNSGWFETNQFMLEVIFHNRMKKYKCLTNDSALASAIFVPYYAGLDVARYLWHSNRMMRDHYSSSLVNWVRERHEWKRMWGRDHFMVAGRITWDFRRLTNGNSDWGNKLMLLPESRNMTMLTIESSPWNSNDFAIPYPTYFHPSRDKEVFEWQNRIRRVKRRYLFSFIGAPRPNMTESIRKDIMDQCQAARRKCRLLECTIGSNKCYQPVYVMKMFQSSTFCLQPPGDSYTRRSTFDAILAGCIPVFFHPGSAYVQYLWHFPRDYAKYSVFIPAAKVKDEKASIERTLSRIPKAKVAAMREQLIKMIPGVVYADPRSNLETLEDAFDITIDGVLERVEQTRKDIAQGKNFTDDFEEVSWKKISFGTVEKHDWDPFFKRH